MKIEFGSTTEDIEIRWWQRENVAAVLLFLLLAAIAIFWRGQPIPFIYQAF